MRIFSAMALLKGSKTSRRPAVNLTLSPDVIRRGRQLARVMNRPSLSNVVEFLIDQADKKRRLA